MYPAITPETMTAVAETLVYLVTTFVAVFGWLWMARA